MKGIPWYYCCYLLVLLLLVNLVLKSILLFQHRLVQVNPKSSSYKYTPKEDGASGFPIDPPGVLPENGFPHRTGPAIPHLAHAGRTTSNLGRPSNGQMPRFNGPDITNFSGPIGMGARASVLRMDSMKESMNKQGNKTGSRLSSYTGGAGGGVVDYTSHLLERPSTSHRKDEPVATKEPHVVSFIFCVPIILILSLICVILDFDCTPTKWLIFHMVCKTLHPSRCT